MALEKILHSIRIGGDCVIKDTLFEEFLQTMEKEYCGVTQVAMFLYPSYHTPTKLEDFKEYLEIYRKRLTQLRERGYSAGLDILATIGHHEENLPFCHADDTWMMTDLEGNVCQGSHCMNDERYLENYVVPLYRMFAELKPDFIWIDDDVRYFHWPLIGPSCFCDGCISLFNQKHGTGYSRETLKKALNGEDIELRKKWMHQQTDAIIHLFQVIGSTVRSISDQIILGFMSCELYVEVYDVRLLAEALSDNGKYEIMWRPGSGCYNDYNFDSFIQKAEKIGRISAYMPEYVTSIQSEMESYPCDLISKTPTSTAAETLLYMSTGCTGTALSLLPGGLGGDIHLAKEHLEAVDKTVPFARLLKQKLTGTKIQGIHNGWSRYSNAALKGDDFGKLPETINYARDIFRLGLPECYAKEEAQVILLTEDMAKAYSKEELLELLKGGLLLSGEALEYINSLGLGVYTGFKLGAYHALDAIEMYTEDPLNEGLVGEIRNCRPVFGAADSFSLVPTNEKARVLSKLVDYNNEEIAACASGVFENALGGRICAMGYHPYSEVTYYWKGRQLKRLFVWLSKNTLPSYTMSHYRLFHVAHKAGEKQLITIFNPTNEHFKNVETAVNTEKTTADIYTQKQTEVPITVPVCGDGGYRKVIVEEILPYEMILIEI